MTKPFVGLPIIDEPLGCSFSRHLDQPSCGQPVTVHVIGYAPGWGWVCLCSCDEHRIVAEAACTQVADVHPADGCSGVHVEPDGGAPS